MVPGVGMGVRLIPVSPVPYSPWPNAGYPLGLGGILGP